MHTASCLLLLLVLLTGCQPAPDDELAPLSASQQANLALTQDLHNQLRQHNWAAVVGLYAPVVRYKGPETNYQVVEQPRQKLLGWWQARGAVELQQVYMANEHHVIVEGLAGSWPPEPGSRGSCVIYTIEHGAITRQFVYN